MNNQAETSNYSRKDDILEKSRQSRQDEGIEHAINEGAKKGNYYAFEIIGIPLFLLAIFTGQTLTIHALVTVYCGSCFGEFLAKYRFLQQKRYLIATICYAIVGVSFAFLFVRGIGFIQGWWG